MTDKTHPCFGTVTFSGLTGTKKLFGSSLPYHDRSISLRISRAVLVDDMGEDRVYSSRKDELIEVYLSTAQFAELLTSMNIGCGVPCTISHVGMKSQGRLPEDHQTETEKAQDLFAEKSRTFLKTLREKGDKMLTLLRTKKPMKVAERAEVASILDWIIREVGDSQPFAVEQFERATQKLVSHAKTEIDSLIQHVVMTAGKKALGITDPERLLGEGEEVD